MEILPAPPSPTARPQRLPSPQATAPIMQKDRHSADVILRSSDEKLFYSWKILLSMSSPVFSDMFTLPQPDTSSNVDDERPVIDLPEDSCTLGHILSLCHPVSCGGKQFKVESVRELGAVLEAMMKYDMDNCRSVVLKELTNPSFLQKDPVRVYALACRCECREAARLAAKHTLALRTWVGGYVPELEKIYASRIWRLLLYREACITAARSLADDHTWIAHTDSPLFGCDGGGKGENMGRTSIKHPPSRKYRNGREESISVHSWWLEYMRKSGYALQVSPRGEVVKDGKFVKDALSAISSAKCQQCEVSEIREAFQSFVESFAKEVDRRVAEVKIDLGF